MATWVQRYDSWRPSFLLADETSHAAAPHSTTLAVPKLDWPVQV